MTIIERMFYSGRKFPKKFLPCSYQGVILASRLAPPLKPGPKLPAAASPCHDSGDGQSLGRESAATRLSSWATVTDRGFLWPGLVAASIAAADAVLYFVLIQRQGDPAPVFAWVFSALVVTSLAVFWASMNPRNKLSSAVLGLATACLFVLGVLGIFSIGIPLLVASMFCLVATIRNGQPKASMRQWTKATLIGLGVIAVALTALYLIRMATGGAYQTERIECVSTAEQDRETTGAGSRRVRCESYKSP